MGARWMGPAAWSHFIIARFARDGLSNTSRPPASTALITAPATGRGAHDGSGGFRSNGQTGPAVTTPVTLGGGSACDHRADGSYLLTVGETGTSAIIAQPVAGFMRAPASVTVTLAFPGATERIDLEYDTGIR
jgi:hypothetical protein